MSPLFHRKPPPPKPKHPQNHPTPPDLPPTAPFKVPLVPTPGNEAGSATMTVQRPF